MGNMKKDFEFLDQIFKEYRLLPPTLFAKVNGITRMTVWRRVRAGHLDYIVLGGIKFIVTPKSQCSE